MRRYLPAAGVAAALTVLTGCDLETIAELHSGSRETQEFHYAYPLQPGGRLSVENFNGAVEITGWNENSVEIVGSKFARTRDLLDEIRVDVTAAPDAVRVRTVRPPGRRGSMGARYTIRVPRRTRLEQIASSNGAIRVAGVEGPARLKTSNGSVRAEDLRGDLEVATSNGTIEVRGQEGAADLRTSNGRIRAEGIRGALEAGTTNGSITAQIARPDPARAIRLATTNGSIDLAVAEPPGALRVNTNNGSITLRLPAKVNARVDASTTNSTVRSDFEVAGGPAAKNRIEGVIGTGGPTFVLATTNGSIRLLRQ